MADFAELIYGTAQNVAKSQGEGLAEGFKTGAELALKKEQLQQQKLKLAQDQQAAEQAKWKQVSDYYTLWDKMPDGPAKKTLGSKVIPANLAVMGFDQQMNPAVNEMLTTDPSLGAFLTSRAAQGQTNQAEIAQAIKDPKKFTELATRLGFATWADEKTLQGTSEKYGPEIAKAEEAARGRQNALEVAQAKGVQGDKRGEQIQKRFDQSQKTKLVDKINSLGIPAIKTSINELDTAIPGGLSGWKPGTKIPGISGSEGLLPTNRLSGAANKVRGSMMSIGNQVLKLRSGAAVSDGEAMRTLSELGMVPTIGEGGTWTGLTWKGGTSEESVINGMKRVTNMVNATEQSYRNAYGSDTYDSVAGKPVALVPGGKLIKMSNGKEYPPAQLQALIKKNPNSPLAAEIKQKLQKLGIK